MINPVPEVTESSIILLEALHLSRTYVELRAFYFA